MTAFVSAERSVGEFTVVDALPEFVVVIFAALTHLADPWFLFGLFAVLYWFASDRLTTSPRHGGATAIASTTCAYAAVALGKTWFAVPRPHAAMTPVDAPTWLPGLLTVWYETQVFSDGFGFPSGHATGAVAAYLAIALLYDGLWTRKRRLFGAVLLMIFVATSRVVIEVHYLIDVIAGILLGISTVVGALWLAGDSRMRGLRGNRPNSISPTAELDPFPVFLLATGISVIAAGLAAVNGHTEGVIEGAIGVATGLGGAIGWLFVTGDEPRVSIRIAIPALFGTGGLWVGAYALSSSVTITLVATSFAVIVVIGLPALSTVLAKKSGSSSVRP